MLNQIRTRLDGLFERDEDVTGETVKTALCLACRDFDPTLQPYATSVDEGSAEGNEFLYDVTGLRSRPFFVLLALFASWAAGAMVWSAKHASGRQDPLRVVSASGRGRVLV